jgi:tetratricopeptide (TPR) repeat protein
MSTVRRNSSGSERRRGGSTRGSRSRAGLVIGLFLLILIGLWFGAQRTIRPDWLSSRSEAVGQAQIMEPEAEAFARYAGSASCRECHEEEWNLWMLSNHRWAERDPDPELEGPAFDPPRSFQHGTQTTSVQTADGQYEVVTPGYGGRTEAYPIERVIGHEPLRQFLVPGPRGRLQTLEASYDPHRNEWFNSFGDEDRQPGEWGHWSGRGMNWNSMCAACHNTRLRKNYDELTDSYRTTMAEPSIGCESCHGPMRDHVLWQERHPNSGGKDPTLRPLNPRQILDTCGSCHARRLELTGDFTPGQFFFDHYSLTIVDDTDTYYPDGQVRDENFEFTSVLGSRMHHAGVRCLDCHNAHSLDLVRPGNDLCMRCHSGGYPNSPIIEPATHSRHQLDDTGGQCVSCHMPHTTYMERHPRRDHSWTSPDPLLTRELGIPNACNRCHTAEGEDVDWAIRIVEDWYGPRMERPARQRTRWIAAARAGQPAARDPLMALIESDEIPYWRAVAAGLLHQWIEEPGVREVLLGILEDPDPLVRAAAVTSLEPLVHGGDSPVVQALQARLEDPVRSVRFRAAWALRAQLDSESRAGRELLHVLDFNADQPGGQAQKGAYALARNQPQIALEHYRRAVDWDPYSGGLRHELAVVLSMVGQSQDALQQMLEAARLEPDFSEYQYRLALAWNEVGRLDQTLSALERAVALNPDHPRAWYNLGLARNQAGQIEAALDALIQAERAEPRDPRIPYARATILAQQGRLEEALRAVERALELRPDFPEAQRFRESFR